MGNRRLLVLVALLLPPIGILLLWFRPMPGRRWWQKILARFAGTVGLLILTGIYLFGVFGMRVEMAGSVPRPIISFGSADAHFDELERQRAAQREAQAPVAAAMEESPSPTTDEPPSDATPPDATPDVEGEVVEASGDPASGDSAAGDPAAGEDSAVEDSATTLSTTDVATQDVLPTPEPPAPQVEWPGFRGPTGDGRVDGEIATTWPGGAPPLLWKQRVGLGYSTFVVAHGVAYTLEQRRDQEVVTAYDLRTGYEHWSQGWTANFEEPMGGDGPRAAPTWDGGELLVLGAEGELRVMRPGDGSTVWRTNILEDAQASNIEWGMSAAPVVVDGLVITLPGGTNGASVVAYHRDSGEIAWKAQNDRQSYTTPEVFTLAGHRQLVVVSAERAMGLEIADGTRLWDYPWVTDFDVNAAQPLRVDENQFFLSAGYDHGAALVRVEATADGYAAHEVWQKRTMKNTFSSSVLKDGFVYGLDAEILGCIDVRTGDRQWKGGRYGSGELLLVGDYLVVSTEKGEVAIVEARSDRFAEVSRFEAISGKTWNHPVLVDGILLVRNHREMAAFDLSP